MQRGLDSSCGLTAATYFKWVVMHMREAVRKGSRFLIRNRRASRRGCGGVFETIAVGRAVRVLALPIDRPLSSSCVKAGRGNRQDAKNAKGGDDDTFGHDLNEMDGREGNCGLPFPDEAGACQILYLLGVLAVE